MREGLTDHMHLVDVDRQTIESFLCWAYKGEYFKSLDASSNEEDQSFAADVLLQHAKVYVLAERFNVVPLKRMVFENWTV